MNRIGFSHGKFDILFISGLKTAYWSRVFFFWRQLFLMTNSKFRTPLTLTSHNSGSKHRSIENHHIFRFVRTSAFTWCSPCRVYEIRMSRKCGKHEKIPFFMFLSVTTVKKSWRPAFGQFWCYRTSPWLILTNTGWSIATVFYDFSLTGFKKQKNGKTQPFLLGWHMDILIFWCLSVVKWEKNGPFRAVPNSVTAPY